MVPASEKYIAKTFDLCKATGEMGVALTEFGEQLKEAGSGSDSDNGPLATACNLLGDTLQAVAEANTENVFQEEALMVSNVQENVLLLNGMQRVFDGRKAALKLSLIHISEPTRPY
eukprot:TRINITY_DN1906_c0_g2_i1.p2 TRINITY_DN1906_c0_g2~~TRINITY_DN1906_c0_g2_i1.p2  ORF type:complete len:116 (+),score=53.50 TRINITY_DN1906_c0_g2_i1:201-548(+)